MATWTELWADCTQRLGSAEHARRVVEQASGRVGASWLITMKTSASEQDAQKVSAMVERLLAGEPLQYVLGEWSFRQLRLHVDRRALIPRPETEQVVQAAIEMLEGVNTPVIVDLGTGSGAIALSMALEIDGAQVFATDVSSEAIELARENLSLLSEHVQERVQFRQGSWFAALSEELRGSIDMIVSNPPYVADNDEIEAVVRDWEPHRALFSGEDGLDAIRAIFDEALSWLNDRGAIVVEVGESRADPVQEMARKSGMLSVRIGQDFSGRSRWVAAKKVADHGLGN